MLQSIPHFKKLFTFLFFIGCLGFFVGAKRIPSSHIKVALLEDVKSFKLSSSGRFEIVETKSGKVFSLPKGTILNIKADPKGIYLDKFLMTGPLKISPEKKSKTLQVNGRRYRDSIIIRKKSSTQLTVINELTLDAYLYGILPREIGIGWPEETMKAQAVAARTYALKNLKRHHSGGYNMCSKVHCQVFGGLESENTKTSQAVDDTSNQVLTFNGKLASTFFFSTCGGRTENPANAWNFNSKVAYLQSVRCSYCKNSRNFSWSKKVSQKTIYKALKKKHPKLTLPIRSIKVKGYGKSGRAKYLQINHSKGSFKMIASRFRLAVGANRVRSTYFKSIKKNGEEFSFSGRGWGHGVGMCQNGAKGLAVERQSSYKKILKYYYPGTAIRNWK